MRKIMSFIAITALLFACSKTESIVPSDQESAFKKGKPTLIVTTDAATYILPFGATLGGSVSKSGGGNKVTERGVCYGLSVDPTIDGDGDVAVPSGSGSGTFTCILPGLAEGTLYYARAYANKSKKGIITTTYGNEVTFTTADAVYGLFTDNDGNEYTTILIGEQEWMMENLKTTKYRNGDDISFVEGDGTDWANLSTGAYCNYGNNINNVDTYGRLYNWFAVNDGRNIAPAEWHVPTEDDYRTLMNYVGGSNVTGIKLKEEGNVHWLTQPWYGDVGGDNSSGFTALPGGCRNIWGGSGSSFNYKNDRGNWWTADAQGPDDALYIYLQSSSAWIWGIGYGTGMQDNDRRSGHSVRLIKD